MKAAIAQAIRNSMGPVKRNLSLIHLLSSSPDVCAYRGPKKRSTRPTERCGSRTLEFRDCQVTKRIRNAIVTGSHAHRMAGTASGSGANLADAEGTIDRKRSPRALPSLQKGTRPKRNPAAAKMG